MLYNIVLFSVLCTLRSAFGTVAPTSLPTVAPMAQAPEYVNMGTMAYYSVFSGAAVTNSGFAVLNGDLGVYPGTSVTGFPVGIVTDTHAIHLTDTFAKTAAGDLTIAINDAKSRSFDPANILTGDLGGMTLVPGVYKINTLIGLTNMLTLDAQHNPDAAWIFQIGTALNVNNDAQIIMINANKEKNADVNVWFVCGSSAVIGTNVQIMGTIMAEQGITVNTGSSTGALWGRIAAVTLLGNAVAAHSQRHPYVVTHGIFKCNTANHDAFYEKTQTTRGARIVGSCIEKSAELDWDTYNKVHREKSGLTGITLEKEVINGETTMDYKLFYNDPCVDGGVAVVLGQATFPLVLGHFKDIAVKGLEIESTVKALLANKNSCNYDLELVFHTVAPIVTRRALRGVSE